MSVGLMCDCPLPPMAGLKPSDRGHAPRLGGKSGCSNYAEDQERGGLCEFCESAHYIADTEPEAFDSNWHPILGPGPR